MGRRRRRRGRRDDHQHVAAAEPRPPKAELKRREAFEAQQASLRRRRTFVGLLAFVPLLGSFGCGAGATLLCQVPQEWWLAIFAALFGSYLGLTIRLFLEHRRFQRAANARSA